MILGKVATVAWMALGMSQTETELFSTKFAGKSLSLPLTASIVEDLNFDSERSLSDEKTIELNYVLGGNPKAQKIVLLHGIDSSLETWNILMEDKTFQNDYQYLAVDMRAHGLSFDEHILEFYQTQKIYPFRHHPTVMALDILKLMDQVGFDKAAVIGHSFGSRPAVEMARLAPERIESLIFEDIGLRNSYGRASILSAMRDAEKGIHIPSQIFSSKEIWAQQYLGYEEGITSENQRQIDRVWKRMLNHRIYAFNDSYRMTFHPTSRELFSYYCINIDWMPSLEEYLHQSGKKALFLMGGVANGSSGVDALKQTISPQYREKLDIIIYQGVGHSVHKTIPQQYLSDLKKFIKEN